MSDYKSKYSGEQVDALLSIVPELSNNATKTDEEIQNINTDMSDIRSNINNKVDKQIGKSLSTEDYTTEEKNNLSFLSQNIKEVPKGVSYDELVDEGIYVSNISLNIGCNSPIYTIVGTYADTNSSLGGDILSPTQTRIYVEYDNTVKIQNRYYIYDTQEWTEWKDVFANISYVDSINKKILDIIDSAPEALNTLNELAAALNNDPDFAATVINQLESKVDKEDGKGLSTEDYTTKEKQKLSALPSDFKELPNNVNIDDVTEPGCYLITEEQSYIYGTAIIRWFMFVNEGAYTHFGDDGTAYDTRTTYQSRWYFDVNAFNDSDTNSAAICDVRMEKRYLDHMGNWSEWEKYVSHNISDGIAKASFQNSLSQVGAKVFKFDLTHEYTEEDISKKKYYLTYVNQLMTQKPFSIVLGENYDFHGTITGMGSGSDGKWYVTVDNYIAPSKTDTRHMISESSYILLPYDNIEDGGDYVPFDHYTIDDETIFGNAHMMGDTPIGTGGASFGYKCYAQNIGTFSAGYMNISSGKYSGTLGRYNVTGYCDFAFGQDIKLFGHWQTGFGRDIFMAQNADYTFGGGRFNKSYGPCQFFAGEGHELYLPYANARGKYSITDSNKYVDKFGWGAAGARKNLYTLDANGNAWFAGEIRCGGSDYDAAARVAKTYSVSSLSALTSLDAKKGDMAIYMNTQQEHWCKLGADGENNGLAVFNGGTTSDAYTVDSEIGGRKCRKIPTQAEHPAKRANRFMYFAMEDLTAAASEITFKIIYYDLGTELIQIQYNAADGAVTKPINVCYRTNTKRWKEATITISDAGFVHSTAIQKQDFRICGGNSGTGTDATYIAEMSVTTHKNTESGKNIHKDVYVLTDSKNTLQNWVQINT